MKSKKIKEVPLARKGDLVLLKKYGEQKLKVMQYDGVLARLFNSKLISKK